MATSSSSGTSTVTRVAVAVAAVGAAAYAYRRLTRVSDAVEAKAAEPSAKAEATEAETNPAEANPEAPAKPPSAVAPPPAPVVPDPDDPVAEALAREWLRLHQRARIRGSELHQDVGQIGDRRERVWVAITEDLTAPGERLPL